MAAGSSSSWTSPEALRSNEFVRLKQNAQHLGLSNSPFLPWSEREFENHKREFGKVKKEEEMLRLRARLEDAEARKRSGAGGIRVGVGECMVKLEGKVKDISGLWCGGLAPGSGFGGKFPSPNLEFKPLLTRLQPAVKSSASQPPSGSGTSRVSQKESVIQMDNAAPSGLNPMN
jgi:hypothetical protein